MSSIGGRVSKETYVVTTTYEIDDGGLRTFVKKYPWMPLLFYTCGSDNLVISVQVMRALAAIARSQLADAARRGEPFAWRGGVDSSGWRPASSVHTCRVILNIGLPSWFAATGLRVTAKQPDSRGIPGFSVAFFSILTQFDVCPVGWYNCWMEFLGRTASQRLLRDFK